MEVLVAKNSGFCFGVRRAIEMALRCVEEGEGPIYTLGPIIHNPQMVAKLKEQGIQVVHEIPDANESTLIVRTHGVKPSVLEEARRRAIKVVNATCPFVRRSQEFAEKLHREGYYLIFVGEADHPEVEALVGFAEGKALVVNSEIEVEQLSSFEKIGVIPQTTISFSHFQRIVSKLMEKAKELRVMNTICDSVSKGQRSTLELARKVDVMVVVGGRDSANTSRLVSLCRELGKETYHVETEWEVDPEWFRDAESVGVSAGASTPDWVIEGVVEKIKEMEIRKRGLPKRPLIRG